MSLGAKDLRDIILGGQDGLVNVLGIVLAMAVATADSRLVIIAGLAAAFAESLSMAGVGYTSAIAARDYYYSKLKEEEEETARDKRHAVSECTKIFRAKGFTGDLLKRVVSKICSNKKVMIKTLMREELDLSLGEHAHPVSEAITIGVSAIIGSLIPLMPFFFFPVSVGLWVSLGLSIATLFITGAVKAKLTVGSWVKSGLEITLIGMGAAILGFIIGRLFAV